MRFPRLRLPRVISLLVLGGVLVAVLLGWTAPAHAAGGRLVDDYRSVYGTPGVAAAVIDGSSVETIVRGRDGDGNAVTARTRFRIASMSESMTAAAIMLLVDRDRVSLDDPVVKLLPDFQMADPRFARITVRQVLSHTSGLSNSTDNEYVFPPPRGAPAEAGSAARAPCPGDGAGCGAADADLGGVQLPVLDRHRLAAALLALFCLICCVLGAVALGRRLWCFHRAGQATFAPVRLATTDS
ncbi:serine hydrolase domain-containing protein [Streptosporangium canum]|uniref:serine hydrolase domain-containing protein n=1 Tax=Streptosporangium canum TaxID=324952 RepID=UPI001FE909DB|nr:serine hydrolase domain-containing protein [Streptosporangium canum]